MICKGLNQVGDLEFVTRLASQAFGVPICAITQLDRDRQIFLASTGIEYMEVPREQAFCNYSIMGREAFVSATGIRCSGFTAIRFLWATPESGLRRLPA
ncbi:MAG: hypothetical protein ACTHJ3_15275 [Pararhizobium sp.]